VEYRTCNSLGPLPAMFLSKENWRRDRRGRLLSSYLCKFILYSALHRGIQVNAIHFHNLHSNRNQPQPPLYNPASGSWHTQRKTLAIFFLLWNYNMKELVLIQTIYSWTNHCSKTSKWNNHRAVITPQSAVKLEMSALISTWTNQNVTVSIVASQRES